MLILLLSKQINNSTKKVIPLKVTNVNIIYHFNHVIIIALPKILRHIKNLDNLCSTVSFLNKDPTFCNIGVSDYIGNFTRKGGNNIWVSKNNILFLLFYSITKRSSIKNNRT